MQYSTAPERVIRRHGSLAGTLLLLLLLAAPIAQAAPVDEAAMRARARELIHQLGDDKFAAREQATQQLIELGSPVLLEVKRGVTNPDSEIRARCRKIARVISAGDRERRLQLFLTRAESSHAEALPGWQQLCQVAGDSHSSRQLMVDILREDWHVLQTVAENRSDPMSVVTAKCALLQAARYRHRQPASMQQMATLVLLAIRDDAVLPDQTVNQIYSLLNQIPSAREQQLEDPWTHPAFRKLIGELIRCTFSSGTAYQCFNLALRKEFPEALIPAERMLHAVAPVHIRQFAVLTIARFGSTAHVPALEELLGDDAICYKRAHPQTQKLIFECRLRDVALATLLHLHAQDPKEFGFQQLQRNSQFVFQPYTVGFANDSERLAAYAKWEAFRAQALRAAARPTVQGLQP